MRKPKVLLVEDNEDLIEIYQFHVGKEVDLTARSNPEDALELYKCSPTFDVVISDQVMPKMTGEEFLKAVRSINPKQAMALVTGSVNPDDLNVPEGTNVMSKPMSMKVLVRLCLQSVEPVGPRVRQALTVASEAFSTSVD